ncbi:MAG: lysyl oxidase family protein [bacterium]|nr:lysyl oxidase family protein [bacterium]
MRKIILGAGVAVVVVLASLEFVGAVVEQQPNITPFPARDIRIEERSGGTTHLRFSTLSWNNGAGPLEIRAGAIDTVNGKQEVIQRIYSDNGTYREVKAGSFVYHPGHSHFHFEDYALYTLQSVDAPGASDKIGVKTTFCIMDTTRVSTKLPGAPKRAVYTTCTGTLQGMSVGWGDRYGYSLEGQSIDITGLSNGEYNLKIEIDPKSQIVESNDSDNISTIRIRLTNGTVIVL